jgi:hypothetical protein
MAKYRDISSRGRSQLAPFVPGEAPSQRHERRLLVNLDHEQDARFTCDRWGVNLTIHNEGHHWIFLIGKSRVEWWPSSAKCVINQNWTHGLHVHDYWQVINIVRRQFPKETRPAPLGN